MESKKIMESLGIRKLREKIMDYPGTLDCIEVDSRTLMDVLFSVLYLFSLTF